MLQDPVSNWCWKSSMTLDSNSKVAPTSYQSTRQKGGAFFTFPKRSIQDPLSTTVSHQTFLTIGVCSVQNSPHQSQPCETFHRGWTSRTKKQSPIHTLESCHGHWQRLELCNDETFSQVVCIRTSAPLLSESLFPPFIDRRSWYLCVRNDLPLAFQRSNKLRKFAVFFGHRDTLSLQISLEIRLSPTAM